MAGYGQQLPAHLSAAAPSQLPAANQLPVGPCNAGNETTGGFCGCSQFWDKSSAELHHGSKEHRSSSERSTTCVCGHHACFHSTQARAAEWVQPPVVAASYRAQAKCDGRCRLHAGYKCEVHKGARASHVRMSPRDRNYSQASTSNLPPVPSVCLLSHERRPATANEAAREVGQSRQTMTGLGLSLAMDRPQSVASTQPDDFSIGRLLGGSQNQSAIPSTRPNSVAGGRVHATSPAPGSLDALLEFNRNLNLDLSGDTIPNTFNPDDYVHSATEVATPSIADTPDLAAADQIIQDGKKFLDTLTQVATNAAQRIGDDARPNEAPSASAPQLPIDKSPAVSQDQIQDVLKSASPQTLQKVISYLAPLHSLLSAIPNVANTMGHLSDRLSLLESNNSFNYVHPDDMHQQMELYDGRLLQLEHWMDDHDKIHQAIDADHSSTSNRRRLAAVTDSFGSNHSVQSATSSTLILAAMDSRELANEIGQIKGRLDDLEAAAMPTSLNPWEVEVVFLPFGPGLRGIWYPPDEPMHDPTKATTQDSEEWTQARNSSVARSTSRASLGIRNTGDSPHPTARRSSGNSQPMVDSQSGWSSQAISDWVSGPEGLLSPKACGDRNVVFRRLQSRGLIRTVVLKRASARAIQAALSQAFVDILEHLKYSDEDETETISSYPGLKASFIPLRKVTHDARLRFLTPAELSNSALWSAQFLASDVLMRLTGGKKRLYVTQREAYIQSNDHMGSSWTWQELRELPRYQPDKDSQMEGNDAQCQREVAEADAREACWSYVEACDAPPPSVHSSFGSHGSAQVVIRQADQPDRHWRRSITPSSILKHRQAQPISPLSEFHPQPPTPRRPRTASVPVLEPVVSGASKRRLNSSPVKYASAPQTFARGPTASIPRSKRRRVANSSSPRDHAEAPIEAQAVQFAGWGNTPRRSRSPFFSSEPQQLPRTNSDITSRPSQRSVAPVGKSTPFAYATPHSGPFTGGPAFGGQSNAGGDTEVDDDGEDDEQSWRGVTDGEGDSGTDSDSDAEAGADEPASFSGDDSSFDDDEDEDGDDEEEGDGFGAQRVEPFDTFLDTLLQ